jgi:hypothetical protein
MHYRLDQNRRKRERERERKRLFLMITIFEVLNETPMRKCSIGIEKKELL